MDILDMSAVIAALVAENAALRALCGATDPVPIVIRSWRDGDTICAETLDGRVFCEAGKSHHEPPYVVDLAGQVWEAAR